MDSVTKLKTTIRLPADLHWRFQNERVNRRLSNEEAILQAFSLWINSPEKALAKRTSRAVRSDGASKSMEREAINKIRAILHSGDSARVEVMRIVLDALSRL